MLKIEHLTKTYGTGENAVHALDDVSFSVPRGQFLAIIGPSGSGKSTMCRTINRLETIDSGDIRIDGKPLPQEGKELAKLRAEVGMVFQSFNLFANKTILENVTLAPIKVRHMDKKEARELAIQELNRVGMGERLDYYPAQLSGGQQQRVAIARALALHPDILCFDEPTSALDPELTGEVLNVIRSLKTSDSTMIVVTHEIEFARDVADKIIFMADGVIAEEGTPEQVINNPQNPRTQAFLSRFN